MPHNYRSYAMRFTCFSVMSFLLRFFHPYGQIDDVRVRGGGGVAYIHCLHEFTRRVSSFTHALRMHRLAEKVSYKNKKKMR